MSWRPRIRGTSDSMIVPVGVATPLARVRSHRNAPKPPPHRNIGTPSRKNRAIGEKSTTTYLVTSRRRKRCSRNHGKVTATFGQFTSDTSSPYRAGTGTSRTRAERMFSSTSMSFSKKYPRWSRRRSIERRTEARTAT
jgi:hypothetical protein